MNAKRGKSSPKTREIRVVFAHGQSDVVPQQVDELRSLLTQVAATKGTCRKHDVVLSEVRVEVTADQTVAHCSPCCVRSERGVRDALRKLETDLARDNAREDANGAVVLNAVGANAAGEDEGVVQVNVAIALPQTSTSRDSRGAPRGTCAARRNARTTQTPS